MYSPYTYNPATYLAVPIIYVTDKLTGCTHAVGTDPHDMLYVDGHGRVQYMNTQCMTGTEYGECVFAVDTMGHDRLSKRFPEIETDLTDDELYHFEMKNPIDYGQSVLKDRILTLEQQKEAAAWN